MKMFVLLSTFVLSLLLAEAQQINVMTFNIRYSTERDSLNAWRLRKDHVASQVLFHEVQLLGVQEALHEQMVDLKERLKKFNYVGVGRGDGKQESEYSAIFYDTTKLAMLKSETFWLSETPTQPGSKSWDAAITRIVTWAQFREKKSGKIFFAFNTHFDHIGQVARKKSAEILLNKVNEIAGRTPAVITGDFNAQPTDEPIRVILDPGNNLRLTNSMEISSTPHYGPSGTFNAFGAKEIHDAPIDYIFLKNKWKVLKHATISQTWQGRFASDHFAVFAVLGL
ncbi:MAG: endonuclease/exonuclease/phosphatase family protein [Ferruginibacter sp.]|nr:endonuclease/exonuclease/phosphatase family protein [Ferruginibacter sp.]